MTTSSQTETAKTGAVTDVIIGMGDGLIVPFALAAGLSAAVDSNGIIIIACLAEIVAGSIAMGLGGYATGKSELRELAQKKAKRGTVQLQSSTDTKSFFANLGLSEQLQEQASAEIRKDQEKWSRFIMQYETPQHQTDFKDAGWFGLNIGLSYIAGGLIPIAPYFFTTEPFEGLKISVVITIFCLAFFGWMKSRVTRESVLGSILRQTLAGLLAGGAAYGVARIFVEA